MDSEIVQFSGEQMAVIKSQIAPRCTDMELAYFIQVCKQTGLSPFTREIYAISREVWNPETRQKEPKMTIQVSIDGLRKRAANSGFYGGSETFWCGSDGQWTDVWLSSSPPMAAKTIVHRLGSPHPFVGVARFDAYKQEFNGKLTGLWAKMPDGMLGKCSEALALRKAFPEQTAGLYASEEMDQADSYQAESKPTVTKIISEAQLRLLLATASEHDLTDEQQRSIVTGQFGFASRKHITTDKFDQVLEAYRAYNSLSAVEVSDIAVAAGQIQETEEVP
jgi:phage recombination protein Bet